MLGACKEAEVLAADCTTTRALAARSAARPNTHPAVLRPPFPWQPHTRV